MADGLPYFKFQPDRWLLGDISFEDMNVQGVYTAICALYWHKGGELTVEGITKKFKNNYQEITELTDRFFSVNENGKISIDWLDEQFDERGYISKVNSKNGSKGGRPKGSTIKETKANKKRIKSETKPKLSQENRIESEQNNEEKTDKKKKEFDERKASFASSLKPFLNSYGKETLNEFYKYWIEPTPNGLKMRIDFEKTWDLERRLETWVKRDKNFNPKGSTLKDPESKVYPGTFPKTKDQ